MKFCHFCVGTDVTASPRVVDTWAAFPKCVLAEKGPYESKRLRRKLPKLLHYAIELGSGIFNPTNPALYKVKRMVSFFPSVDITGGANLRLCLYGAVSLNGVEYTIFVFPYGPPMCSDIWMCRKGGTVETYAQFARAIGYFVVFGGGFLSAGSIWHSKIG